MGNRFILAALLVFFLTAGVAEAQTVVTPADVKSIYKYGASYFVSTYPIFGRTTNVEARLFFEFDLSNYRSASTVIFPVTIAGFLGTGNFYLQPMTTADGSVTIGDFSRLGSPIWTGTLVSGSSQSFTVSSLTSWFNSAIGGYAGFALTSSLGTAGVVQNGALLTDATAVPEPGTFALFGFGLASLFLGHRIRRRRKSRTAE